MDEKGPKRAKQQRIKLGQEGLSLLQSRFLEAHRAALESIEPELRGGESVNRAQEHVFPPKTKRIKRKKDADSEDVSVSPNLGGFLSQKYTRELSPKTEAILRQLFEYEANDLDNRLSALYSGLISLAEFEKHFRPSFIKRVKLEMSGGRLTKDSDALDLRLRILVEMASLDFFNSLRASEARGDDKKQALRIAANSHWLSPDALERLGVRYPKVEKSVLYRAVEGYPSAPEEYIEGYLKRLAELQANKKMRGVSLGILKYAVLHAPRNPESYVAHYLRVKKNAPNAVDNATVKPNVIERAARRVRSTKFLSEYVSRMKVLEKDRRFEQLGKSTLERAARDYTSVEKAQKFLLWYLEAWEYLGFLGFRKGLIRDVLFSNAFKRKEDLKKLL